MASFYKILNPINDINPDAVMVDLFSDVSSKTTSTVSAGTEGSGFVTTFTLPSTLKFGEGTLSDLSTKLYVPASGITRKVGGSSFVTVNMYKLNENITTSGDLDRDEDIFFFSGTASNMNVMMNEDFTGTQKGFGKASSMPPSTITRIIDGTKVRYDKAYMTVRDFVDTWANSGVGSSRGYDEIETVRRELANDDDTIDMKQIERFIGFGDNPGAYMGLAGLAFWEEPNYQLFWVAQKDPHEAWWPAWVWPNIRFRDSEKAVTATAELNNYIEPSNSIFNMVSHANILTGLIGGETPVEQMLYEANCTFATESAGTGSSMKMRAFWARNLGDLTTGADGIASGKRTVPTGGTKVQNTWAKIAHIPKPIYMGPITDTLKTTSIYPENGCSQMILPYIEVTLKINSLAAGGSYPADTQGSITGTSLTNRCFAIDFTSHSGNPTPGESRGSWMNRLQTFSAASDDTQAQILSCVFINSNTGSDIASSQIRAYPINEDHLAAMNYEDGSGANVAGINDEVYTATGGANASAFWAPNPLVEIPTATWFKVRFYMPRFEVAGAGAHFNAIVCMFFDMDDNPLNGSDGPSSFPIFLNTASVSRGLWWNSYDDCDNMYLWLENKPAITTVAANDWIGASYDDTNHETIDVNTDKESEILVDNIRFINFEYGSQNHSSFLTKHSSLPPISVQSSNIFAPLKAYSQNKLDNQTTRAYYATATVDLDEMQIDKYDLVMNHTTRVYSHTSADTVTTASSNKYLTIGIPGEIGAGTTDEEHDEDDYVSIWGWGRTVPSPSVFATSYPITKKALPGFLQFHGFSSPGNLSSIEEIPEELFWCSDDTSRTSYLGEELSKAQMFTAGNNNNSTGGVFYGSGYYHDRFNHKGFNTLAGTAQHFITESDIASCKVLGMDLIKTAAGSLSLSGTTISFSKPQLATLEDQWYAMYSIGKVGGTTPERTTTSTGSAAIADGGTSLAGSGAAFTTELAVGGLIHFYKIDGTTATHYFTTVKSIANDNVLEVTTKAPEAFDSAVGGTYLYYYGDSVSNRMCVVKLTQTSTDDNLFKIVQAEGLDHFITKHKLSNIRIAPLGRWHRMFVYNVDDNLNLISNKSYTGVSSVSALPNADGSDLGPTYSERLFSLTSANMWRLSITPSSIVETSTDYGFGALEGTETQDLLYPSAAAAIARTPIVDDDTTYTFNTHTGTKFFDTDSILGLGDNISLLFMMEDTIENVRVLFNNKNHASNKPVLKVEFTDELPEKPILHVAPNEENPFFPEFTWEASDSDLWYGFLIIDNNNITNQYHNAVLHYQLNEDGIHGATAAVVGDTSLEKISGTVTKIVGAVYDEEGLAGNALNFDGNDDYIECNTGAGSDPTADCTTEMSVIAHIVPDSASDQRYIVSQSHVNDKEKFHLRLNTSNQVEARVHFAAGANYIELTSSSIIVVDGEVPTNIILTVDTTLKSGNVKLYINGKLEDQTGLRTTAGGTNNWKTGQNINGGNSELYIGYRPYAGSSGFDGKIEEVVVYKKCIYPIVPTDDKFLLDKPISELNSSSYSSPKSYIAKLFIKDYHNIRGSTIEDVATSSAVSWRKASFVLDTS